MFDSLWKVSWQDLSQTVPKSCSQSSLIFYSSYAKDFTSQLIFPQRVFRYTRPHLWPLLLSANDWYEIWALTTSNGPFLETEKGFGVGPTPGGSQCTGVSPTLSWKWPRATLSPSFGPFFERNHSLGVKMDSENFWNTFKSCTCSWDLKASCL